MSQRTWRRRAPTEAGGRTSARPSSRTQSAAAVVARRGRYCVTKPRAISSPGATCHSSFRRCRARSSRTRRTVDDGRLEESYAAGEVRRIREPDPARSRRGDAILEERGVHADPGLEHVLAGPDVERLPHLESGPCEPAGQERRRPEFERAIDDRGQREPIVEARVAAHAPGDSEPELLGEAVPEDRRQRRRGEVVAGLDPGAQARRSVGAGLRARGRARGGGSDGSVWTSESRQLTLRRHRSPPRGAATEQAEFDAEAVARDRHDLRGHGLACRDR